MGYEQMGDRGPFCFLAAVLSGQSHQRRQDHWERSAADEQSGQYHIEVGGHHPTALMNEIRGPRSRVLRGPTPPTTDQTSQVQSCQAWIPGHANSGGLKADLEEFLERVAGGCSICQRLALAAVSGQPRQNF